MLVFIIRFLLKQHLLKKRKYKIKDLVINFKIFSRFRILLKSKLKFCLLKLDIF